MEERKEEGEAEIQEHGPEHWFSKWERQCLAEAEQGDPNEEETEQSQQKLWHLFQNSATAVAQLYKGLYQRYRDWLKNCQLLELTLMIANLASSHYRRAERAMGERHKGHWLG